MFAPIALFVYNRPSHTRQTIEALLKNDGVAKTSLYVFSDGPRNAEADEAVTEVRAYIRSLAGFESVTVIERETNFGLARSIIDGVTRVCKEHGRVIVMEDDIVTSPHFLGFMNGGLDLYEHDERVISLHGYVYPAKEPFPEIFFLRGADCWGWATWKRGWDLFEPDGQVLLRELRARNLMHQFDLDGAYPYTRMLKNQIAGKNDSWAVRWHASAFLMDKLTLYSGRSLVLNIGTDSSGTHCSASGSFAGKVADSPIKFAAIAVEENVLARQQIIRFNRKTRSLMPIRALRRLATIAKQAMS